METLSHEDCVALALGVAAALSGGACFSPLLLGLLFPSIMSQSPALRLKLLPSLSVVSSRASSEPQALAVVLFCPE